MPYNEAIQNKCIANRQRCSCPRGKQNEEPRQWLGGVAAHTADSFSALKMSLIVDLSY